MIIKINILFLKIENFFIAKVLLSFVYLFFNLVTVCFFFLILRIGAAMDGGGGKFRGQEVLTGGSLAISKSYEFLQFKYKKVMPNIITYN